MLQAWVVTLLGAILEYISLIVLKHGMMKLDMAEFTFGVLPLITAVGIFFIFLNFPSFHSRVINWIASGVLTYGYKPLNGDAAVLVASVPFNWRTSTYSYYAVPIKGNKKEVLVTSYMTNRGFASGPNKRSTMAPAFLVRIDGDTTKVENIATAQGDWVYDKKSKRKSMIAKNIRGAHLKGEPIDHSLLEKA